MMRKSISKKARALGLSVSALVILAGCATQDALNEQTEPIKAHVATLDQGVRQASDVAKQAQSDLAATRERELALARKIDDLSVEAHKLGSALADQASRAAQAEGRAGELGARIASLQTALDGLTGELAAAGREAARRLEGVSARQDTAEGRLAGLASRLDSLMARIDDNARLLERVDAKQTEALGEAQRAAEIVRQQAAAMEALRAQLGKVEAGNAEMRQGLETNMSILGERLAGLTNSNAAQDERMARGDARLDALTRRLDSLGEDAADLRRALDDRTSNLPARLARLESRMDDLQRLARSALDLAAQMDIRSNGKVAFSVVLTDDKTLYPLNLQQLAPRDRTALDALVQRLKTLDKDYHLEIQGHTDNTSVDDYNYQLGKARAEVVKRYLHEQGGIPLGWMSVISYGATQPLDPKGTNNRRIVIQTLVLEKDK